MIFDLNQTGLRRLFKEWHVKLLEHFWETQKSMGSSTVWKHLEETGVKASKKTHGTVSRASVIYFLNDLVDEGILTYTEGTGKGGYHRIYSLAPIAETEETFKEHIFEMFTDALVNFLEE